MPKAFTDSPRYVLAEAIRSATPVMLREAEIQQEGV